MLGTLLVPPALAALATPDARLVRALRLWTLLRRTGQCPTQAMAEKLGSLRAAAHLHFLLEEVAAAWPEPFAVSPLCCRRLSHDEALLADMLRLGRQGDRPAFDRLLSEMIPADERERLFLSASVLSRAMAACPDGR